MNLGEHKCVYRSCECCYGYPLCGQQSVLLNGLSNATHLELIADPEVVCINLLPLLYRCLLSTASLPSIACIKIYNLILYYTS
jgi:hypothetical protein